jgi:hypothetical protein
MDLTVKRRPMQFVNAKMTTRMFEEDNSHHKDGGKKEGP